MATERATPDDMVGKALHLLTLLGQYSAGRSISDISRESGFPLSTTHRLLGSLARHGFVESDSESRRYRVGIKVFELGQRVSHARGFAGTAIPVLQSIVDETGEAALLAVREATEQLYVHSLPSPRPVQIKADPGSRGPLHATAMGKVLVAFSPSPLRDELIETLPLTRLTANTITDREVFRQRIEQVRATGYGTAIEENEEGVNVIGVPLLSPTGDAFAAIAVAAPATRVDAVALEAFLPVLRAAAERLAVLLPRP